MRYTVVITDAAAADIAEQFDYVRLVRQEPANAERNGYSIYQEGVAFAIPSLAAPLAGRGMPGRYTNVETALDDRRLRLSKRRGERCRARAIGGAERDRFGHALHQHIQRLGLRMTAAQLWNTRDKIAIFILLDDDSKRIGTLGHG
jgi:hypothetical protein